MFDEIWYPESKNRIIESWVGTSSAVNVAETLSNTGVMPLLLYTVELY